MPRRIEPTLTGKQMQEVWWSANGGLMDAYGIAPWFNGLSFSEQGTIQEAILTMPFYKEHKLSKGDYEVHRIIFDQYAWQYGETPPIFNDLFNALLKMNKNDVAQVVMDEWIAMSNRTQSIGQLYQAHCEATLMAWKEGYQGAKLIREQGLHNALLRGVVLHAYEVLGLFRNKQIPANLMGCPALDKLFMLYIFRCQFEKLGLILVDLKQTGYGHLQEVICWEGELQKEYAKAEKFKKKITKK